MMEKQVLNNIIKDCRTPAYVFDESVLAAHVQNIRKYLSENISLCYAMKANPFLTKLMSGLVDRLEVCSPGEYDICIKHNINPGQIVVSGVNKTEESMRHIMSYSKGRGIYTIESPMHYSIIKKLVSFSQEVQSGENPHGDAGECEMINEPAPGGNVDYNGKIKVMLRLSAGNQFGMDKETLINTLTRIKEDDLVGICGIQYYSGTQKTEKKMITELKMLEELGKELTDAGFSDLELEYGPGLFISYFDDGKAIKSEDVEDEDSYGRQDGLYEQLTTLNNTLSGISCYRHISIELGRYIAALCGSYITKIIDIKHTKDTNYIIIDGGIHQINYYGQMMGMKLPYIKHIKRADNDILQKDAVDNSSDNVDDRMVDNSSEDDDNRMSDNYPGDDDNKMSGREQEESTGQYTICGSLCTTNDVLVRKAILDSPSPGDILVFEKCGAYSVTEGMALFLSRELPQVLLAKQDGSVEMMRDIIETSEFNCG